MIPSGFLNQIETFVLGKQKGTHGSPGISPLIMPSGQDVGDAVGAVVGPDVGDVVGAGDGPVLSGDFVGSFVGDGVGPVVLKIRVIDVCIRL